MPEGISEKQFKIRHLRQGMVGTIWRGVGGSLAPTWHWRVKVFDPAPQRGRGNGPAPTSPNLALLGRDKKEESMN